MGAAFTVLALARQVGGHYTGEVVAGIMREVHAAGGAVVVIQAVEPEGGDRLTPVEFALPVACDAADAVISLAPAATKPYLELMRAAGKPVVLASEQMPGFDAPVASPDNRSGVRAGVAHLVAHGHTRIGFVGDMSQHDFRERRRFYAEAMAEHGLPATEDLFFAASSYSSSGGEAAAPAFLASAERPTAVLTATDDNAFGFIAVLARAGVSVPTDVAVIGFDDVEEAVFASPSLSTVHQRFDEVGALAARLAIAMLRGEQVPADAQVTGGSVLVTRGSCGCRTDVLDDGRPRGPRTRALPVAQPDLTAMLHTFLDRRDRGTLGAEVVHRLVGQVDQLLATDAVATHEQVAALVRSILQVAPRDHARNQLVTALTEYLSQLIDASVGERSEAAAHLSGTLWQLQAHGAVQQGYRREASVLEHGEVAASVLRMDAEAVRRLDWIGQSHMRAGVLALWEGPPENGILRVTGVHDRTGDLTTSVGQLVHVGAFPPPALVAAARPQDGEFCLVVPVRTAARSWGVLAVLAVVNTEWNREPYQHWADMLCLAFESEALAQAVRESEQRYAYATRASNDGLWELDVGARTMYLSARCRELVGLPQDDDVSVQTWQARIHPEDRTAVDDMFIRALQHAERSVEIEYRVQDGAGGHRWLLAKGLGVRGPDGTVRRVVGSLADIDRRHRLEEQLRLGALHDPVTGLPNRRLFHDRLTGAIERVGRRSHASYAVIFLDLDGFKMVNDSLGHLQGDELLKTVAERLRADLRGVDTAARFGGDEFAILLSDPVQDEALVIAQRIQERIAAPIVLEGHEVSVTASIGIATSQTGYADAEDVLRDADIAMYHAKATERGSATLFDPEMHTKAAGRLRTRAELRTALAERQFVVHYQPIVALDGSAVQHFEALVRWQHPTRGLLPPVEFLPAMEENATVVTLGQWVLDDVCRQVAAWHAEHGVLATVSVNLSHREFWTPSLPETVTAALRVHGIPASSLVLEITESVIMVDHVAARRTMDELHGLGPRLHIDDFGTGHSSLAALRTFPVDALKIDGSFIRELDVVAQTTELVRIIIDMGAALGVEVVAECVETEHQAARLRAMGCHHGQGWLYAAALPAHEAGLLLGTSFQPAG